MLVNFTFFNLFFLDFCLFLNFTFLNINIHNLNLYGQVDELIFPNKGVLAEITFEKNKTW